MRAGGFRVEMLDAEVNPKDTPVSEPFIVMVRWKKTMKKKKVGGGGGGRAGHG